MPPPSQSAWDSRKNNFDFLRLFFAVLVIYSHAYPLGLGSEQSEPFRLLTHGQLTGGAFAVDAFFIMSGFLIAASAQRSSTIWSFLKKRVTRIYPAFLLYTAIFLAIFVPLAHAHLTPRWPLDIPLQTLRLTEPHYTSAFAANPYPGVINGSIWSIPYEFFCYLGVALLTLTTLLRRRLAILVLFLGTIVISVLSQLHHWNYGGKLLGVIFGSPQFWARLLPLYLAGVVFYLYRRHIPLRTSFAVASALILGVACILTAGLTAALPIAGTYLLFWFSFTPTIRLHHFGRFGDFSYGTYLYAFPIEQLLVHLLTAAHPHPVPPVILFALATPLSLAAAAISWYGIERRFLQPIRQHELPTQTLEQTLIAT